MDKAPFERRLYTSLLNAAQITRKFAGGFFSSKNAVFQDSFVLFFQKSFGGLGFQTKCLWFKTKNLCGYEPLNTHSLCANKRVLCIATGDSAGHRSVNLGAVAGSYQVDNVLSAKSAGAATAGNRMAVPAD